MTCHRVLLWGVCLAVLTTPALAAQGAPDCAAATTPEDVTARREAGALSSVLATVATVLDKLELKMSLQDRVDGIHAEIDRREPIELDANKLKEVQNELKLLALGQRRTSECRIITNLDYFLVESHVKYKGLKGRADGTEYERHIKDIDANIHDMLERRGLLKTMSAVLRGGIALVDVARDETVSGAVAATPTPKSVSVLLGTKHWGDEEGRVDFSINGQVGVFPILAAFREDTTAGENGNGASESRPTDDNKTVALHQSGLLYEAYLSANVHLTNDSEGSVFFGGGQTRLLARDANIGTVQKPEIVSLVKPGPDLSAYRYEYGLEYRLYAQALDIVHHDKSLLSPVFSLAVGWRSDERFMRLGVDGGKPHKRMYGRLGLDLRQVIGQRKVEDRGKRNSFGFRFVAEREWGRIVPAANRILLEADVDLSRLLVSPS